MGPITTTDMAGFPGNAPMIHTLGSSAFPGIIGQEICDRAGNAFYKCLAPNYWCRFPGVALPGIPGQSENLVYVSDGDTNGIFYRLGTNYGAQAWANPVTGGFVTVGGYEAGGTSYGTGSQAVDRVATDDNGITVNAAGNYWKATFPLGTSVNPNGITIRARPVGSGTASNVASYIVQGSLDGTTWTNIYTVSGLTYVTEADYKTNLFTATGVFYPYIRLLWQSNVTGGNSFFFLTDWELYGQLLH